LNIKTPNEGINQSLIIKLEQKASLQTCHSIF